MAEKIDNFVCFRGTSIGGKRINIGDGWPKEATAEIKKRLVAGGKFGDPSDDRVKEALKRARVKVKAGKSDDGQGAAGMPQG